MCVFAYIVSVFPWSRGLKHCALKFTMDSSAVKIFILSKLIMITINDNKLIYNPIHTHICIIRLRHKLRVCFQSII